MFSGGRERVHPRNEWVNSRNKDIIKETYLSCLEERLVDIEITSKRCKNLTKGTAKGFVAVVWKQRRLSEEDV